MLNDFVSYMNNYITVEEMQGIIILIIISTIYIFTAWIFDKYDKYIEKEIKKRV